MKDLRDSIFKYIFEIMTKKKNSLFLSIDQGSVGYEILKKKFPKRCLNIGISEQNAVGIASGLSLGGKIVFLYGISSFIYSRAYEQIKLNLCSMNLKVCIISSGPGYCYAPDGPTHYSLDDINILNSIPNIKIYSPFDDQSCKKSIYDFIKSRGPAYIRADKGNFIQNRKTKLDATEILKGKNIAIITHGYFVNMISKKIGLLLKKKIGFIALNKLKTLNVNELLRLLKKYKKIIYIDDSWEKASFGIYLSHILTKKLKAKFLILSSKEEFYKKGGSRDDILKINKIDFFNIYKKANKLNNSLQK